MLADRAVTSDPIDGIGHRGGVVPWVAAALGAAAAILVLVLWAPWRPAPVPMPRKLLATPNAQMSARPGWKAHRVCIGSRAAGHSQFVWVNADGTGEVERLSDSPGHQIPASWHPGGKFLAFGAVANPAVTVVNPLRAQTDLMILPMDGDASREGTPGKPFQFLKDNTPAVEGNPMFSPDGRWIAYASNESGISRCMYGRSPARAGDGASRMAAACFHRGPPRHKRSCFSNFRYHQG